MSSLDYVTLKKETVEKLKTMAHCQSFQLQSDLFYEGQTPCVAYLLSNGQIHLLKKKKIKKIIQANCLLGVVELMDNSPATLTAQAQPGSTIYFFDRSTILEITKDSTDEELKKLFNEVISPQ